MPSWLPLASLVVAAIAAAFLASVVVAGVVGLWRESFGATARQARQLLRELKSRRPVPDTELVARGDACPAEGIAWCAVRHILARHLGLDHEKLLPDDDFRPLADDMDTVELVMDVERAFNVTISDVVAQSITIISIRSLTAAASNCPPANSHFHQCRDCGHKILQFQDGCPECGAAVLRRHR